MRIFKNSISLLGVKALRTTGALHQDHVHTSHKHSTRDEDESQHANYFNA